MNDLKNIIILEKAFRLPNFDKLFTNIRITKCDKFIIDVYAKLNNLNPDPIKNTGEYISNLLLFSISGSDSKPNTQAKLWNRYDNIIDKAKRHSMYKKTFKL